jgi:hypothetical protein
VTLPGTFSLADGTRYAEQMIALIQEACDLVLIAGAIRRRTARVNEIVLVAIPTLMATDDLFSGTAEIRDLLREVLDRLVAAGRLEREIGATPPYRWGKTRREALYVAPNGTRVPVAVWWASWASLGLQYALATGPERYAQRLLTHEGQRIDGAGHCGILPRTFSYRHERLVWTLTGEVMPVLDESALERCLGRRLPEPRRRR